MISLDERLGAELATLKSQNLLRRLRCVSSAQGREIELEGRTVLNFSSNDYMGLANHPALKEAAIKAVEKYGAGSGASRLISGSLQIHSELEQALAEWKGTEAALTFSSGFNAALGTIGALLKKGDIIILDKLIHASIVDAARMSGATLRIFKHNDMADLEEILKWGRSTSPHAIMLVVTESVFSMDGDIAPLWEMVELKEKYQAWLMVDEAHGCGMFGGKRAGMVEHLQLRGRVEVQMGTLGKAIGSAGGFIAGSKVLIDYLLNRARSFIFSTAPIPAQAAAALAGIRVIQSREGEKLADQLQHNLKLLNEVLARPNNGSPIVPVILGSEERALAASSALMNGGIFVPAIRYPTVARGKARLRLSVSASHNANDIRRVADSLHNIINDSAGVGKSA